MNAHLERCQTFINCQLQPAARSALLKNGTRRRAVTISRQAGSGGHIVAQILAEYLQAHAGGNRSPWAVFDRNLVEKVLEDHNLPARLVKFMPEDRVLEIDDTLEELFGLHPLSWTLVRKTTETILHLAELGNVILIGRCANVITSKLDYVFHVRLVGSLEKRIEHIQKSRQVSEKAALDFIRNEDRGRRRYMKKYFSMDIDDPLLYHMVINTDLTGHETTAEIIGNAVLSGCAPFPTKPLEKN